MTRNRAPALFLLPVLGLALAACGTPRERCVAQNTREYRAVTGLLGEVEGNLARGYAWEERQVIDYDFVPCQRVVRRADGSDRVVSDDCWRRVVDTERFRVPIDPLVEARKRDNLLARRAALEPGARQAVEACRIAHAE